MSDDLRDRIMAVLRDRGWTCDYHEPVSAIGECGNCDTLHGDTADAVIRGLGLYQTMSGQYSTSIQLSDKELDSAGFTYHRKDRR